jgi:adenylyltransferase/sulfurtransferase
MEELTEKEQKRYHRQMLLPGWGTEGQQRLKEARVFVAGAGGLGSPMSIYLAVAGVGEITVVDRDVVDLSNLNRQILHSEADVDRPKAVSAEETLMALNQDVTIKALRETISEENVHPLVGEAQIIVDCMDNFPTRYLLNRVAIDRRIPLVHGAVWGLEGRLTFIEPGQTPCLRCLVSEAPPAEVFPVVGSTPGVIACLQATEVLKYLTGLGDVLRNRLLLYDGLTMEFQTLKVRRDPNCPECGALWQET